MQEDTFKPFRLPVRSVLTAAEGARGPQPSAGLREDTDGLDPHGLACSTDDFSALGRKDLL